MGLSNEPVVITADVREGKAVRVLIMSLERPELGRSVCHLDVRREELTGGDEDWWLGQVCVCAAPPSCCPSSVQLVTSGKGMIRRLGFSLVYAQAHTENASPQLTRTGRVQEVVIRAARMASSSDVRAQVAMQRLGLSAGAVFTGKCNHPSGMFRPYDFTLEFGKVRRESSPSLSHPRMPPHLLRSPHPVTPYDGRSQPLPAVPAAAVEARTALGWTEAAEVCCAGTQSVPEFGESASEVVILADLLQGPVRPFPPCVPAGCMSPAAPSTLTGTVCSRTGRAGGC
jgi:hypothetical protein